MANFYVGIGGWTYEPWRGPYGDRDRAARAVTTA